ncbi:uncharacterized protein LOC123722613 [Papilio machaon]|uniref:uncharacterized protein LOC123722613 n=1 Tax=Papilio machaon TaxID=76193 RepID=UPI001E66606B|nr:uncharacterized protein LOC123722613 [Papilio machaon]
MTKSPTMRRTTVLQQSKTKGIKHHKIPWKAYQARQACNKCPPLRLGSLSVLYREPPSPTGMMLKQCWRASISTKKAKTSRNVKMPSPSSSNHTQFLQINLHHSETATAQLRKWLEAHTNTVALIQEPWVRADKVLGLSKLSETTVP